MLACVTTQGTAMSETAICAPCARDERNVANVLDQARAAADWAGAVPRDCGDNDQLICQICGLDPNG